MTNIQIKRVIRITGMIKEDNQTDMMIILRTTIRTIGVNLTLCKYKGNFQKGDRPKDYGYDQRNQKNY